MTCTPRLLGFIGLYENLGLLFLASAMDKSFDFFLLS